jgi:drug/metabolite transporter (DMT)-like permease
MPSTQEPGGREQQLLRHARREGLVILAVWAACLVWTVGYSLLRGYGRDPETIPFILGIPDWVFWAVFVPWGLSLLFSVWFCFGFMADDDLGRDRDEEAGHV